MTVILSTCLSVTALTASPTKKPIIISTFQTKLPTLYQIKYPSLF
ncbi:hypothetical protein [Litchfieldia alkalitelluris]|nr:hypothetical protein [Litchfieldia alkalitelluris]